MLFIKRRKGEELRVAESIVFVVVQAGPGEVVLKLKAPAETIHLIPMELEREAAA